MTAPNIQPTLLWVFFALAVISSLVMNILWFRAKCILEHHGYTVTWLYGHWRDLTHLDQLIAASSEVNVVKRLRILRSTIRLTLGLAIGWMSLVFVSLILVFSAVSSDGIISVESEDPEMKAAILKAKETMEDFLETFANPTPQQKSFLLKIAFDTGDSYEHIWLADLDLTGKKWKGVVANEPRTKKLQFMQTIVFDPMYVSDWMYVENGRLVGGFTTRVLRNRMPPEERQAKDANSPYKF